jgi:hypothetical protein
MTMEELLHALRIKGRATVAELLVVLDADAAAIEAQLRQAADEGLAIERTTGRRPGWMLSAAGRDRHAALRQAAVNPAGLERLAEEYKGFLRHNDRVKGACTRWQTADGDEVRFELLEELHDVQERVAGVLNGAGEAFPRFGRYGVRLAKALERAEEDPRYVVSPVVDSYHTVWFECHEDFLVTLGRSRHEEGSW